VHRTLITFFQKIVFVKLGGEFCELEQLKFGLGAEMSFAVKFFLFPTQYREPKRMFQHQTSVPTVLIGNKYI